MVFLPLTICESHKMLTTLVLQTRSDDCEAVQEGKSWRIRYNLAKPLIFSEPHVARLIGLSGPADIMMLFADFVAYQPFNSEKRQFLGMISAKGKTGWVPLATDRISSNGHLIMEAARGTALRTADVENSTFIIEIAPTRFVYPEVRKPSS